MFNEWPRLLEDLKMRRDCLNETIAVLEKNFAIGTLMDTGPAGAPAEPIGAKKADKRTNERTSKPRAKRVGRGGGFDEAVSEKGDAIVLALKKHGPIMKPGLLASTLGYASTTALSYHVKPLVKAKRLVLHGSGGGRLIGLPGHKPAKEHL